MHADGNSAQRHVIAVERNGVTHVATYTIVEGVIRIRNPMGLAVGPARDDPQGEALRLFDRLVQTYEGNLRRGDGNRLPSAGEAEPTLRDGGIRPSPGE
jgi:hypothetical protein